jgi:hypothetical protein
MRLPNQAVLASSRRYLELIGGKPMSESGRADPAGLSR